MHSLGIVGKGQGGVKQPRHAIQPCGKPGQPHPNPPLPAGEGAVIRAVEVCGYPSTANGRISISLRPGIGLGQRFTQATASSISLTSQIQKPATSSRVSVKGPSVTVRWAPSNATRLAC